MSCSVPKNKLPCYSNIINIYDNKQFIKLPTWLNGPPPPSIYLSPQLVHPPLGPYIPPVIEPYMVPTNYPNTYNNKQMSCGPCGR